MEADNPVRLMDAFVDKLNLEKLGFTKTVRKSEGRPPFAPGVLLKLYLYGYLNKIRSSRKLERECARNIELQWLLQNLRPNYHTIADFRKVHPEPLKAMFKLYVQFLGDAGLLGKAKIVMDGGLHCVDVLHLQSKAISLLQKKEALQTVMTFKNKLPPQDWQQLAADLLLSVN